MFVDRVIADLEAGKSIVAFPTMDPIRFDGGYSLYSVNYNEDMGWDIHARFDTLLMAFPITELSRMQIAVELTKDERKRLRKAADEAIKVHVDAWKRRKQEARY